VSKRPIIFSPLRKGKKYNKSQSNKIKIRGKRFAKEYIPLLAIKKRLSSKYKIPYLLAYKVGD